MANVSTAWKTDNYKFVGQTFDYTYGNRMNKLLFILGEFMANSVDYQLDGLGGFGEYQPYDGNTLVAGTLKRGFTTVITPKEFNLTYDIGRKQSKIDKLGITRKIGRKLGLAGSLTVYVNGLRLFARAFDTGYLGGDGKPWAATDHPVASKGNANRASLPDPEAGTFSNIVTGELTVDNITKAQTQASRYVTPDGLPFACEMNTVLVSPELEGKARQLFGTTAKLQPKNLPGTSLNDANPVSDMRYIVVGGGNDGFTGKQWAICDPELLKDSAGFIYNEKPQVLNTELDNPLIDRYVGYIDYAVGFGDARPIIFGKA